MLLSQKAPVVLIHWPRLGPYHVARLQASAKVLAQHHLRLEALEIYGRDHEYLWENIEQVNGIVRHTLFPKAIPGEISTHLLARKIWECLEHTRPHAVAINGYASWDALLILLWCNFRNCSPILMSETKSDDDCRTTIKEKIKQGIVKQYTAALCGGTPHRAYLELLGMSADKIFDGYDVVDNLKFMEGSDRVRLTPELFRSLPGLQDASPYFLASGRFLPRKNFLGLIKAYQIYDQYCQASERCSWRLLILGGGPQQKVLVNEIHQNRLQTKVCLAGIHTIDELQAYYGLAAAFIHPPLQEQWGLVVNEAMASRLPILVSKHAGCVPDLIQDGVEGFSFDPKDIAGLADMMFTISSMQIDLEKMGSAARNKIMSWGPDRFAKNLLQAITLGRD